MPYGPATDSYLRNKFNCANAKALKVLKASLGAKTMGGWFELN